MNARMWLVGLVLLLPVVYVDAHEGADVLERAWQKHFCSTRPAKIQTVKVYPAKVQTGYETKYWKSAGLGFTWRRLKGRKDWGEFLCLGKWRTYHKGIFKRHPAMPNLMGVELEGKWVYLVVEDADYNPVEYQSYQSAPAQGYMMPSRSYTMPMRSMPLRRYSFSAAACST